jgi:hypothetical protein
MHSLAVMMIRASREQQKGERARWSCHLGVALSAAVAVAVGGCLAVDESAPEGPLVDLHSSALSGDNLAGTNLGGSNLGGSNLGGTNLGGSNLGGNNLGGSNLGGTNLGGTNLGGNNLGGNNLGGSNLGGTNLGGNNLGGNNLGGSNLGGTNLGGSNLGGTNLGGNNLGGTNLGGNNLSGSNSGQNIYSATDGIMGMLHSREDLRPKTGQCIVMGIGSTAFPNLLGQQSAGARIYVALGKLPWGFASSAGGPITLSAWEAVVWGNNTYCSFVLAAPPSTNWAGVAGFIKAVFRWNAPPTQTMDISGIEASAALDPTVQTTIATYTGMMGAGALVQSGAILAKDFVAGELAFITATTNNQSVLVDFSSWVRGADGQSIVLGNVQNTSKPTHADAVYQALDNLDGQVGIMVDDAAAWAGWSPAGPMPATVTAMNGDLEQAWTNYQAGGPKPIPLRCGAALYLETQKDERLPLGKCDDGLAWRIKCYSGAQSWRNTAGTTSPFNEYMVYGSQYKVGSTCEAKHLVLSETYVHLWDHSFKLDGVQYQAEATGNTRSGQAAVAQCSGCSGGSKLLGIGGSTSNYLVINNVNVASAGVHTMRVRALGGSKTFYISANGGTAKTLAVPNTSTSTPVTYNVNVTLNAGSNSIKFYNNSATAPQLDSIVVVSDVCAESDAELCYRLDKNCGTLTATDLCGVSRTVACGSCVAGQTCGYSTANACGAATSLITTGGTVSAYFPQSTTSYGMSKAFDNSLSTQYYAYNLSGWLGYQLASGAKKVALSYKITSGSYSTQADPRDWMLEGSNNGTTWIPLDTRRGQVFTARGQTKTYSFKNITAYNRFRLHVLRNNNAAFATGDLGIAEVQLLGYTPPL